MDSGKKRLNLSRRRKHMSANPQPRAQGSLPGSTSASVSPSPSVTSPAAPQISPLMQDTAAASSKKPKTLPNVLSMLQKSAALVEKVQCPACSQLVSKLGLNMHLDRCLTSSAKHESESTSSDATSSKVERTVPSPIDCESLWFKLSPRAPCAAKAPTLAPNTEDSREQRDGSGKSGSGSDSHTCASSATEDKEAASCFLCSTAGHFAKACPRGPYYVFYFRRIAETMLDLDANTQLFCAHDRAWAASVLGLPMPQLRLFVRIFNRVDAWLRVSQLSYDEVTGYLSISHLSMLI